MKKLSNTFYIKQKEKESTMSTISVKELIDKLKELPKEQEVSSIVFDQIKESINRNQLESKKLHFEGDIPISVVFDYLDDADTKLEDFKIKTTDSIMEMLLHALYEYDAYHDEIDNAIKWSIK